MYSVSTSIHWLFGFLVGEVPNQLLAVPKAVVPSVVATNAGAVAVDTKAGSRVNDEEQMSQTRDGIDSGRGGRDGGRWGAHWSVQHSVLGITVPAIFLAVLNHARVARRRATSIRESLLEEGISSALGGASWGRARPLVMQQRPAAPLDRRRVLMGLGAAMTAQGLRILEWLLGSLSPGIFCAALFLRLRCDSRSLLQCTGVFVISRLLHNSDAAFWSASFDM